MIEEVGRRNWVITLSRTAVLTAAKRRAAFHKARVKHWLAVRGKAEKAVKMKGIKIVPNIHFGNTSVGYNMPKREIAQLDEKLINEVMDANRKVEEHRERVRGYEKYVQFLTLMDTDDELELTIEDAEYFGVVWGADK
jgi:hypothetical protein